MKIKKSLINKEKTNYYVMCLINMLQGLVFYGPIATIFREDRGLTLGEILIIESVLLGVIFLFEVPWGIFADKFGYKKTIIISIGILFISKIVFYNSYDFQMFLIQSVLSGIAMAGMSGCDYALIYESINEENSEKVFGVYQAFGTFGFFVASIGASFLSRYSLDITVIATIIAYGLSFASTFFLIPVKNTGERLSEDNIINVFKSKIKIDKRITIFLIFLISIYIVSEVSHSIGIFLNQLQYERSNISYTLFGIISAISQLLCMLSSKTYLVTRKIGQMRTVFLFVGVIVISNFILIFNTIGIVSILLIITIQVSMAILNPIIADIENKSIDEDSKNRATILSIYSMIYSVVGTGVNFITGLYSNKSVGKAFIICFSFLIISVIGIVVYSRYLNRKSKIKNKI